jgi:hypothetical protein
MATVNVTLSLSSTDLFAKQSLSLTETDALSPAGDQMLVGRLVTTGSGTEDNIALKALDGTNDLAYVFLHNLSATSGEYVKIGLCSAHGTDSTTGDWFAVLGPGEFMFMPISDMQDIDIEAASGNPVVEYVLMEKAA